MKINSDHLKAKILSSSDTLKPRNPFLHGPKYQYTPGQNLPAVSIMKVTTLTYPPASDRRVTGVTSPRWAWGGVHCPPFQCSPTFVPLRRVIPGDKGTQICSNIHSIMCIATKCRPKHRIILLGARRRGAAGQWCAETHWQYRGGSELGFHTWHLFPGKWIGGLLNLTHTYTTMLSQWIFTSCFLPSWR